LLLIYLILFLTLKPSLRKISKITSYNQAESVNIINQLFDAFALIKVLNLEEFFQKLFNKYDYSFRMTQAKLQFLSAAPRYLLEAIGITVFSILMYYQLGTGLYDVAVFGSLLLGLQRTLPLAQQAYANYSNIIASKDISKDIFEIIKDTKIDISRKNILKNYKFHAGANILVEDISFIYPSATEYCLKNINLQFTTGSMVVISGPSGCGKSTLVDLITGLVEPTSGSILLPKDADELILRKQYFGIVPQKSPILNGSIYENVALGIPPHEIDKVKVRQLCKDLDLTVGILNLKSGYDEILSSNGGGLSGGQRQRLGLARALYRSPKILILDEVTSGADKETEKNILRYLKSLTNIGTTIIIISHSDLTNSYATMNVRYKKNGLFICD
jgi:ATP-binding cassette subfamily B protein